MVTIRQRQRPRPRQRQRQRQPHRRQQHKQLATVASEDRASTVALTVTNLTANEPKHHTKTIQHHNRSCRPQIKSIIHLSCGNIKFGIMLVLILVIAIALIDAAAPNAIAVPSPDDSQGRFFSKPLPILGGDTQQLIAALLQQYQPVDRSTRQNHNRRPAADGNIFAQLNSFIQARQRNASDIAGNIIFKYFNT